MCGIVGAASVSPLPRSATVDRMRDAMLHRGPDDAGTWRSSDGRVWLAHRRLAIVDLSAGGHQPMVDRSGGVHLVFNGEIYNHRALRAELEACGHVFRSSSDTEVLLEAYSRWGTDCLEHLNGMFAFALHDAARHHLFLARDRAGEKPLFYRQDGERLWFASELKALLEDPTLPRRVDLAALNHYLAYGYVPGNNCMLEGFRKLAQGQAMTFDLTSGRSKRWTYWQLPRFSLEEVSGEDLTDELEWLLRDSVKLRLDADVPVGILLSGGIDSSLLTAVAAELSAEPLRTFTVSFPDQAAVDEGPYARIVAQHFGTKHTELVAEPADLALLPQMALQFDEPMADSSMIPTFLVCRLIREHATVAVSGDGGDELFGGYPHYTTLARLANVRRVVPVAVRSAAGALASSVLPTGFTGRAYLAGLGASAEESVASCNLYFDSSSRKRLTPAIAAGGASVLAVPEAFKASLVPPNQPVTVQCMAVDFMTYLVDDILVKVDRSSMLTSLEVRSPMLDPRIIDFAFAKVPPGEKVRGNARKVLTRRLARRLLPESLDLHRKQGFSLPLEAWFRGEWGGYVESVLLDGEPACFDRAEVRRLIQLQRRGYHNTQRLYSLMMFELWRRQYRVEVPDGS